MSALASGTCTSAEESAAEVLLDRLESPQGERRFGRLWAARVEAARDGADLAGAEGRARFLSQARGLWQALPELPTPQMPTAVS